MIAITKLETLLAVAAALERVQAWEEPLWDADVEEWLRRGERLGWVSRLSTSQAQWTDAAVEAFREFRAPAPAPSDDGVDRLARRALQFLLSGGDPIPAVAGAVRVVPLVVSRTKVTAAPVRGASPPVSRVRVKIGAAQALDGEGETIARGDADAPDSIP